MNELLSPYLVAVALGWAIAQGLKYIYVAIKKRSFGDFRLLYASGSMPSAHTTTVIAFVTVVAFKDGINSGLFGLAALFASVVMYDAVMVRRSVGEQGGAIQQLIRLQSAVMKLPRAAKGHTPLEVLAGVFLGVLIGSFVALLY